MLASVKRHPIAQWLRKHFGTIMVFAPIVTGVWAIWWTFEQDRQFNIVWEAKDIEWNADILASLATIRREQAAIRKELALQTGSLDALADHAQENEDGIEKLTADLAAARASASYQRGAHMGQHSRFIDAVDKLERITSGLDR